MDKTENNLEESIEEPYKEDYCKEVTAILTKNARDHFITLKTTQELGRVRLAFEHMHIDERIAVVLKRIESSQQEAQELDRQLYNATEVKNQAMTRFERTGEMVKVLKEEAEKVKNNSEKIEIRQLGLNKKLNDLTMLKSKSSDYKKKLEHLELEISTILDKPEPRLNEDLIQENLLFKRRLEEKVEASRIKKLKKQEMKNLNDEKVALYQEIIEKQERNNAFRAEVNEKKEVVNENIKNMKDKFEQLQERVNQCEKRRNEILESTEISRGRTEEIQLQIEEANGLIAERENSLKELKEKIEIAQSHRKVADDKSTKEYECELENLKVAEQKLQRCLSENNNLIKDISQKSEVLHNLKDTKVELIIHVCEKKNALVSRQRQNADQQHQIDNLRERFDAESKNVADLKEKNHNLYKQLTEVEEALKKLPMEMAERRENIILSHGKRMEELQKQRNFHMATIEFLQLRLDENLKKIEILKKEIKDCEESTNWQEIMYNMRTKTAKHLEEKVANERAAYEKLAAELNERAEEMKQNKKTKSVRKEVLKDTSSAKISAENTPPKDYIAVEIEENPEELSGRKSPGILKSPFKSAQQSNKRVTFEGLSSTESSSVSLKSQEKVKNDAPEDNNSIEELFKDWTNPEYSSVGKRRNLDF